MLCVLAGKCCIDSARLGRMLEVRPLAIACAEESAKPSPRYTCILFCQPFGLSIKMMNLLKISVLGVLAVIQSTATASTTSNVEDFKYGGIGFGMTEDEVLEVLASNYSIAPDDLDLRRSEYPLRETGDTNLIRQIAYGVKGFSVRVSMYPDLELVGGDYMVVDSFEIVDFSFDDIDVAKLDEMIAKAEEEYGAHSLTIGEGRHRRFYWCTKIKTSPQGRDSCDNNFPWVKISNTGRLFENPLYQLKRK